MSPFSFYIGGSPTSLVVYIVIWLLVLGWLLFTKRGKSIPGGLRAFAMIVFALVIISVTVKVGHRQADLNRQSFDTPTLTDQKEVVVSTRPTSVDAGKALEVQIEKQREENTK